MQKQKKQTQNKGNIENNSLEIEQNKIFTEQQEQQKQEINKKYQQFNEVLFNFNNSYLGLFDFINNDKIFLPDFLELKPKNILGIDEDHKNIKFNQIQQKFKQLISQKHLTYFQKSQYNLGQKILIDQQIQKEIFKGDPENIFYEERRKDYKTNHFKYEKNQFHFGTSGDLFHILKQIKCLQNDQVQIQNYFNQLDKNGRNFVYYLCKGNFHQIISILFLLGCDVNQKQFQDTTALHCASYYSHSKLVEIILKNGIDPNYTNQYGSTPEQESNLDIQQVYYEFERNFRGVKDVIRELRKKQQIQGVLDIYDPYKRNKCGFYVNINKNILPQKAQLLLESYYNQWLQFKRTLNINNFIKEEDKNKILQEQTEKLQNQFYKGYISVTKEKLQQILQHGFVKPSDKKNKDGKPRKTKHKFVEEFDGIKNFTDAIFFSPMLCYANLDPFTQKMTDFGVADQELIIIIEVLLQRDQFTIHQDISGNILKQNEPQIYQYRTGTNKGLNDKSQGNEKEICISGIYFLTKRYLKDLREYFIGDKFQKQIPQGLKDKNCYLQDLCLMGHKMQKQIKDKSRFYVKCDLCGLDNRKGYESQIDFVAYFCDLCDFTRCNVCYQREIFVDIEQENIILNLPMTMQEIEEQMKQYKSYLDN